MDEFEKSTQELIEFIQSSPSAYHVIENICALFGRREGSQRSPQRVFEEAELPQKHN